MSKGRKALMARFLADNPSLCPEGAMEVGYLLQDFLMTAVADEGTCVDSGAGCGEFDLWVTVAGKEWYINIKKSGNQLAKESQGMSV